MYIVRNESRGKILWNMQKTAIVLALFCIKFVGVP